jgi:hypothetical protein
MPGQAEPTIRMAAERAAAEVYESVTRAALEAARAAVQEALSEAFGAPVPGDVEVEDRVTRTEAARRLGTTSQTIIRLEKKGEVHSEHVDGRVYVRLSEVRDALR